MTPNKGDVIQFKPRDPYVMGDRYEVHKVSDGRVYFYVEEPGSSGYGSTTIDGWAKMKAAE
jgi:hypothetical protein